MSTQITLHFSAGLSKAYFSCQYKKNPDCKVPIFLALCTSGEAAAGGAGEGGGCRAQGRQGRGGAWGGGWCTEKTIIRSSTKIFFLIRYI